MRLGNSIMTGNSIIRVVSLIIVGCAGPCSSIVRELLPNSIVGWQIALPELLPQHIVKMFTKYDCENSLEYRELMPVNVQLAAGS